MFSKDLTLRMLIYTTISAAGYKGERKKMDEEIHETGEQLEAAAPVDEGNEEHVDQRQVPLDALEQERAQRQHLQEELRMLKDNMQLLQQSYQQPKQEQKNEFDNLQDDDVLTVGEAKKFISSMNKQYQTSLQELKISQKHPDYTEVVTKYLPDVIKQNPGLAQSLQQTQDYELAYYLAKNSDAYKRSNRKKKVNEDAERIVQNANRSGAVASVGQNSPISEAKRWRDMSDDEFRQQVSHNLGYY